MTKELKKEILDILDNVYYWETCPQEYNDRIDAIKKQLTTPVANQHREMLEWMSKEDYFNIPKDEISEILDDWSYYNSN